MQGGLIDIYNRGTNDAPTERVASGNRISGYKGLR